MNTSTKWILGAAGVMALFALRMCAMMTGRAVSHEVLSSDDQSSLTTEPTVHYTIAEEKPRYDLSSPMHCINDDFCFSSQNECLIRKREFLKSRSYDYSADYKSKSTCEPRNAVACFTMFSLMDQKFFRNCYDRMTTCEGGILGGRRSFLNADYKDVSLCTVWTFSDLRKAHPEFVFPDMP